MSRGYCSSETTGAQQRCSGRQSGVGQGEDIAGAILRLKGRGTLLVSGQGVGPGEREVSTVLGARGQQGPCGCSSSPSLWLVITPMAFLRWSWWISIRTWLSCQVERWVEEGADDSEGVILIVPD